MKKNTLLLFFLLSLYTCKKKEIITFPSDMTPTPVLFYVKATVEGEVKNFEVGKDAVTMSIDNHPHTTDLNSFFSLSSLSTYPDYTGNMLTIGDISFLLHPAKGNNSLSMLSSKNITYSEDEDSKQLYYITANSTQSSTAEYPTKLEWYLNDSLYSDESFIHFDNYSLNEPIQHIEKITLKAFYKNGLVATQTRNYPFTRCIDGNIVLNANFVGLTIQPSIGFHWDDFVITPSLDIKETEGLTKHTGVITDSKNSATTLETVFYADWKKGVLKAANFRMESFVKLTGNFTNTLTICYNYKDGQRYRSDLRAQPASSSLQVLGYRDVVPVDAAGKLMRVFDIKFNCMLYSFDGKAIEIKDGRASISYD